MQKMDVILLKQNFVIMTRKQYTFIIIVNTFSETILLAIPLAIHYVL